METKKFAFVVPHFGSNPVYLELAMYFVHNLRLHTIHDIVWMYSSYDTPPVFIEKMKPLVTAVHGYNDDGVLVNVPSAGKYTAFSALRTCNFMYALLLTEYDKVCVIESDIVILRNIDPIFKLRAPAIITYRSHREPHSPPQSILDNGMRRHLKTRLAELADTDASDLNGGVVLLIPNKDKYVKCFWAIKVIIRMQFAYPNESLFQYVFTVHYNLPVIYNLSHYHLANVERLYKLKMNKIIAVHFNETPQYKHIDIVKSSELEEKFKTNRRYPYVMPIIEYFRKNVYLLHRSEINSEIGRVFAANRVANALDKNNIPNDEYLEPISIM